MNWAALLAALVIVAFPVAALLLASLGGWPGVAGIAVVAVAFLAFTIRLGRVR